jgi:hypothetical protein
MAGIKIRYEATDKSCLNPCTKIPKNDFIVRLSNFCI